MPSIRVAGHSAPQPGQTGAQYGSPLKRPSIAWSLPDAVAIDVTSMSRMRIAIASPTSAPATATGWATSWPPRIAGVIIGPQQPGAVLTTMWPPSATGPSIGTSGPSSPSVNVSTKTVRWGAAVAGTGSTAMGSASGDGDQQGDLVAVGERVGSRHVAAAADRQRRRERRRQLRLLRRELLAQLR